MPGFLSSVPDVCSILPGHLEEKWSQDPVLVPKLNIYGNVFGWFTKNNPPLPLQLNDISNSGGSFHCFSSQFFVNWQRSFLSPSSQHPHWFCNFCEAINISTNKQKIVPVCSFGGSTSTIRNKASFREQVHVFIVWEAVSPLTNKAFSLEGEELGGKKQMRWWGNVRRIPTWEVY